MLNPESLKNLSSQGQGSPFFDQNIDHFVDLVMAVMELHLTPEVDPILDQPTLYAFSMGFLLSRGLPNGKEMIEAISVVMPFLQGLLNQLDQ